MSVTGTLEENVTVTSITKQLADLEEHYRSRKRKLKALLAVLEDEEPKPAPEPAKGKEKKTDGAHAT